MAKNIQTGLNIKGLPSDNQSLVVDSDSLVVTSGGTVGFGLTGATGKVHIQGDTTGNTESSLVVQDSNSDTIFEIKNDSEVNINSNIPLSAESSVLNIVDASGQDIFTAKSNKTVHIHSNGFNNSYTTIGSSTTRINNAILSIYGDLSTSSVVSFGNATIQSNTVNCPDDWRLKAGNSYLEDDSSNDITNIRPRRYLKIRDKNNNTDILEIDTINNEMSYSNRDVSSASTITQGSPSFKINAKQWSGTESETYPFEIYNLIRRRSADGTFSAETQFNVTLPPSGSTTTTSFFINQDGGVKFNKQIYHGEVVQAIGSASYTVDLSESNIFHFTLNSNTTLDYSNAKSGTYIFKFEQDGTGNRVLSFASNKFRTEGGTTPTLSTTAGAIDILSCIYSEEDGRMYIYDAYDFQDVPGAI